VGESFDRYETLPSPYQTETRIRAYTFNSGYKLSASTQLTAQLERREDRLENSGLSQAPTPGQAKRHQDALGAGLLWNAGPASLQLHARHDRDSQFGSATTGTVAAGYSLSPAWRLQAQLGSAFRAPSLYQQFSDYGVAGLQPERGRNAELGLHWSQGSSSAGFSAYRNEIRDLIIFGAAGACLSQFGCYENVNKGLLQGLSLRGATRIATLRLSGSLDLQSPKDATPGSVSYGKLLARRSKTHLSLRADTELGAWSLGAQLLASAKRYDNAANTARLGGYATLDLEAQRSLGSDLRLQIKLDNAFDREYQTARGYASAPRQLFVGLRYTL
jgi:vitamin B12 transporter